MFTGERLTHYHKLPHYTRMLYYIPVIFLAQIQASYAGEIQHDGKKKSVSTHSEIQFQI